MKSIGKNPIFDSAIVLDHLNNEKKVLQKLLSAQQDVYRYVAERNWICLNDSLELCNICAADFEAMEHHRAELTGTDLNSFYEFAAQYPIAERTVLNNSFRELKQLFTQSRIEHESLESYVDHATALLNGFFNAVMPSRRNKIYSRSGAVVKRDVESLVLNRAL